MIIDILRDNPNLPVTEVLKKIGGMWRELDDTDKVEYLQLAAQDKVRYKTEVSLDQYIYVMYIFKLHQYIL